MTNDRSLATFARCVFVSLALEAMPACVGVVDGPQSQSGFDGGSTIVEGTGGATVQPPREDDIGGGGVSSGGSGSDGTGTGGSATGGSATGGSATGGAATGGAGTGGAATGGRGTGGTSPADGGVTSDGGTSAPTWTQIYTTMLNNSAYASNCTGANCHNPGTRRGISFASSSSGYTSVRGVVTPGSATAGRLIQVLSSGAMPAGRPKMPTADLDKIKAWIVAGALNN